MGLLSDGRRMHLETLAAFFFGSVVRGVDSVMIPLNLKLAVVPFFINLPASNPITVTHWYIVLYLHIIAVTFTMNANDGTCMRAAAKEQILLVVDHFSILRYKWRQDCAVGSRLYVCFFLDQPFNLCMYRCVDEN